VEGKLLVTGADAAETFDASEEVLHAVAELVVSDPKFVPPTKLPLFPVL
jgi:hypothetical protein